MMKIAMVNSERLPVPPILGGAIEQTLYETSLAINEPELCVVSPWHPKLKKVATSRHFFHVKTHQQVEKNKALFGTHLPTALKNNPHHTFYYQSGVTDILQKITPDTIQVHNRPQFSPYFAKQFPNAKHILYMHNALEKLPSNFVQNINLIDHFVFVSHYLKKQFLDFFPDLSTKTTVIHNSVDTQHWHPKLKTAPETQSIIKKYDLTEGQTLLYVGRIVPPKGVHLLLQSFSEIQKEKPRAKLIIAGRSSLYPNVVTDYGLKIQKQASQMGASVILTNQIPHAETPYYFAAADLTVLPTQYPEAFGKIIIESMATGTPVLASNLGGIPEIIQDNITGKLLPTSFNPKILAQQILSLLDDPMHLSHLGITSRKMVEEKFSKPKRIAHLKKFYRNFHNPSWIGSQTT